jgi:hypothetical protein
MQWELVMNLRPEVGILNHAVAFIHLIEFWNCSLTSSTSSLCTTTGKSHPILASESQREQPCHPSIGIPEVAVQYFTLSKWIIIGTEIPRIIAPALLRKPQALDWLASFRDLRISYYDPLSSR